MLNFFKGIVDWISEKLNREGIKKTVTAILLAGFIFMLFSTFENDLLHKFNTINDIRATEAVEDHQSLYIASRDMYSQIKHIMRGERAVTGADYILLLEYHNGSENIATGYQFCKFDVTIEELSDSVPYIHIDNFKDENLYKYDILLSDRVTKSKMSSFTLEEVAGLDRNLMFTLHPNDHTQQIVFYNIQYNGMIAGTLMFMYKKDYDIDYRAIANCGADIETVITDAMSKHELYMQSKNKNRRR